MLKEYRKINRTSFIIAIFLSFLVNFDSAVTIPIIANYARALGASMSLAGVIVGAYSLAHVPSNIFLGRLADKVGRKKAMFSGFILDSTALFIYYLSENPYHLLVGRLLHGLGGGFGGPSSMSYIGDSAPRTRSGRTMAIYGISVAMSYLIGMVLGGVLSTYIGYKKLFLGLSTVLLLAAILTIILEESFSGGSKGSLKDDLLLLKRIISSRNLIFAFLGTLSISVASGVLASAFAVYLKTNSFEDMEIGMLFGLATLVSLIIHYPSGLLGDKWDKRIVISFGLTLQALAFVILAFTGTRIVILGMIIWGLAHGLTYPNASGLVRENTSLDDRGMASGIFYALLVLGVAVSAPIAGFLAEASYELAILLGSFVPASILVALILISIKQ